MKKKLMPELNCDATTLEDAIYLVAFNIEKALLISGAEAGKDYTLLDLHKMAMPLVTEMWKENKIKSLAWPSA